MKKHINIITILLTTFCCKAQTISLEQAPQYNRDEIKVDYIKDINNSLNIYEGTWKGFSDNKNYEIRIFKYTSIVEGFFYRKKDELNAHYIVKDNLGRVLENTITLSNNSPLVIRGYYLREKDNFNSYIMHYRGRNSRCGEYGKVILSPNTDGSINFTLFPPLEVYPDDDCPEDGGYEFLFPLNKTIVLSKK